MDLKKISMKMETFGIEVTMKTVKDMDVKNVSIQIKMETLIIYLTVRTVFIMDFQNISVKMVKFI